jgi:cytidylate kinase
LVDKQRDMATQNSVVMEGRDIGTVVFPHAEVKIFLDASPEERARRRATDPAHAAGTGTGAIQDVATALAERDRIDSTRAASPLKIAADAVRIDTTAMSIEEAVARVMDVVEARSIED